MTDRVVWTSNTGDVTAKQREIKATERQTVAEWRKSERELQGITEHRPAPVGIFAAMHKKKED